MNSTQSTANWCATMASHHHLLDTDSDYSAARDRIEESFSRWHSESHAKREELVTIPVVVHVVWKEDEENISDEQIHSQIEVLNQDYRKKNPDVEEIPEAFRPIAADANIEFALATEDPDGEQTDGIVRVETEAESFDSDDAVKSSDSGGSDAWPSDKYLNVWVCKLRGGLLGYAQFPGGPAATDGVVVTYTAYGATGTAKAPFNLGRTTVHEIGHWLNLRHIWGDDGEACEGTDYVDDTPNQGGPNSGCPTFPHVTCDNGPDGDLFVNYMDYSDDKCTAMFTEGQVERMDACLAEERKSFLGNAGGGEGDGGGEDEGSWWSRLLQMIRRILGL
ncbi:MAG: zinc metalloprotease [Stackebrandtia sp.]